MSILLVFHSGFIFSSIILYIYPMRVLFCLFIHLSLSNLLYLSFPQYTTTCILFFPSRVLYLSFVHSCISCIPSFTMRPSFLPQLPAACEIGVVHCDRYFLCHQIPRDLLFNAAQVNYR